jgi:phosphoadenosine phosphosulfate reductase
MGLATHLHARPSATYADKVARARALLADAAAQHPGRIVQTTGLGAEGLVITALIAADRLPIPVATLDTGMLHAETLALIPRLEQWFGIRVDVFRPTNESVIRFVTRHGPGAIYDSVDVRKACCATRKLEPMKRLLAGRTAWITGLRREQSDDRAEVVERSIDEEGRTKVSPLADWTWGDVWHFIKTHEVPYNALHDEFYPSIGCAPCTRAIAIGEPFRAGRWWWENGEAKECGLHISSQSSAVRVTPRAHGGTHLASLTVSPAQDAEEPCSLNHP